MTHHLDSTELKRLHRGWRRRTEGRVAIVLDGVQNPFNVGSILRTAAAYGVEQIWVGGAVPSPTDTKVNKTALGSGRYLRWDRLETGPEAIEAARDAGYLVVGIELADGATPLHELELPADVALVVGHEDRGLSKASLAACDRLAYLPLVGRIGSLNVATATAVALAEVRRRAWS